MKKNLPHENQMSIPGVSPLPTQDRLDLNAKKQTPAPVQRDGFPEKLGKAVRLPVPDFSDPLRRLTCLEADFPIARINALSNLEGNAGKPIYQMSKWWARRRSSVFRSMLIAAATVAPDDPNEASKLVWDHYYCNHQKAGSFKNLRVLDPFMGGGTTLVEGSRLGMQMTGVDLNPVAWFVVKNELACSDPEQVKALFAYIEHEVKPRIQPFYTTTCPRGHKGRWVDVESGESVDIDPIDLAPDERARYRWEGPEVIYTFWAKHGPCQARDCGHRTPIFKTPVIAEKKLTAYFIPTTCPSCGLTFNVELGETRMSPSTERVVLDNEPPFTELSQPFATRLRQYSKGSASEKRERITELLDLVGEEKGLRCPHCSNFAGNRISTVLQKHATKTRTSDLKKKDFGIESRHVYMYLLIHPKWLSGAPGFDNDGELGGYAGAPAYATRRWYGRRLSGLGLVEVRGRIRLADEEIEEPDDDATLDSEESGEPDEDEKDRKKFGLPRDIALADGTVIRTREGTVLQQAQFTCASCGKNQDRLGATKKVNHTAPVAPYALQCYCPQCESEGFSYGGRYFKAPQAFDIERLSKAGQEWSKLCRADLKDYWPEQEIAYSHMTHERNPLPDHGYTHWWKFFGSRQLLVHATLLKAITEAPEDHWSLDVREQALGAFQQYLRNQNMFSIWDISRDCMAPFLSNANYNPRSLVVENNVFHHIGRGNWASNVVNTLDGVTWTNRPWEVFLLPQEGKTKSEQVFPDDPVIPGNEPYCSSSTDLSMIENEPFDLVITDPPFGNNVFYADLADFFYAWLRIPLRKWYAGLSEAAYFEPERTSHSMEAIDNAVEHPDDREDYEKELFVTPKHLSVIQEMSGDGSLAEKDVNPLFRPQPSSEFYSQTLSACWTEAGRRLKDGGIMAFTFHHNEDQAWVDILKALFDAGFMLVTAYPIRSDESKGTDGQFGSKKIEYDIIHVCRKRLDAPEPVSWARMRRWVKDETVRLKELLEHTHGKELPESDLRVILRGKSLEFYSRHYGQVFTGEGQSLDVRDALLGINQLLDDLLEDGAKNGGLRAPESAEPASRLYLRLFRERTEMHRDELHKMLRSTGIAQADLEARGWVRLVGKTVHAVPVEERFSYFTAPGRNRKVIRTDLDQAHFLIGAAHPGSGIKVESELSNPNFRIKKSVDEILKWYSEVDKSATNRSAAHTACQLVEHWRNRKDRPEIVQPTLFDILDNES
jgi:putative DNA methylase